MPRTDIEPMSLSLDGGPWQTLPEMAADHHAERAGILAGLSVVQIFHLHAADRLHRTNRQAALLRLNAAVATARLRADIEGAMK